MRWMLAVVLLGASLGAGCVSMQDYCLRPNLTAHAVAPDAPAEAGTGDVNMTIRVVDVTSGEPIPGAPVRAYWPVRPSGAPGKTTTYMPLILTVEVARNEPATASTLMYVDLHTNSNGTAMLHVPDGALVTAVATAEGHTMESSRRDSEPGVVPVDVKLHRSSLEVSRLDTWTDVDVRGSYAGAADDVAWFPKPLPWHESEAASRNYTIRMVELTAELRWDNAPPSRSDMGLGLGVDDTEMLVYQDAKDEVSSLDAGLESFTLTLSDFEELQTVGKETLYLGPTYDAMVAPLGMTTNLTLRGRFDTEAIANKYCTPEYAGVENIVDAEGNAAPQEVEAPAGKATASQAPGTTAPRPTSQSPTSASAHPSEPTTRARDGDAPALNAGAASLVLAGAVLLARRTRPES